MGIISPLVSIDLFKGRLRITESFKGTKDMSSTNVALLELIACNLLLVGMFVTILTTQNMIGITLINKLNFFSI